MPSSSVATANRATPRDSSALATGAVAVGVGFHDGDDLAGGLEAAADLAEVVRERAEIDGRDGGGLALDR
jgi:hypothetical protein